MKARAVKLDGALYAEVGALAKKSGRSRREELDELVRDGLDAKGIFGSAHLKNAIKAAVTEWGWSVDLPTAVFIDRILHRYFKTRGVDISPKG
jgi:hypothetical protein